MEYRQLSETEIKTLENQHCVCDKWCDVTVAQGFTPDHVFHARFSGVVSLGLFNASFELEGGLVKHSGLRHVTLHNCSVGDDTLIENVANYIANYNIGSGCFIQNVNLMVVEGVSKFGNATAVTVLNETGGREVPIFDQLSAHLAYIIALYRYRPLLISNLQRLIDDYAAANSSTMGAIGEKVRIINTGTIRNARIGAFATIDGASRLENGTINSNQAAPVHVGHNVIASDFIFSSGARVADGAVMVRAFVGQACHLGHLFSAHDSLFFSNCQGENGEACAIFAGPYTVSMHKSSLLIAGMFSFLNAGSGSNQSNHMYKLGPIHQGIVERGSKTTSDSYILWPAKIGAFSLVMGRHVNHPDTSDLPFSYLIENSERTYIVPAINLRSVGTIRDSQKWSKRDRRTDTHKLDFINFNLLSPYTVSRMLRGVELLTTLQQTSGRTSAEYTYNGTHITNASLRRGVELYTKAIDKFFGNSLIKRLENIESGDLAAIRARLLPDSEIGNGEWLDLAGLIAPKSQITELVEKIEQREITDTEQIHEVFQELHARYYDIEWTWAYTAMQKWYSIDFKDVGIDQILSIIERWRDAVISIDKLLYEDAKKEFSLTSHVGFGADGRQSRQQSDFEQVRGSFHSNPFVVSVLKHIEDKTRLADDIVGRLSKK